MLRQDLLTALQAVLIFVGLNFAYWVFFKGLPGHSTLAQALRQRIRLWVYLLIPLVTFWWFVHRLIPTAQDYLRHKEGMVLIAEYLLLTVLSVLVIEATSAFVFDYIFAVRRKTEVPHILRSLAHGVVYTLLLLALLPRFVSLRDVAGLVTGSAILSIILGLALQDTLGNLFAGIGMQISRPYLTGHWVKVGNYEGVVERADWRSMTLRTLRGDHVSFPHSLLAKMEIHNYSSPSPLHAREVQVGVHYRHPPYKVEEILKRCALETDRVLPHPVPEVRLTAYQDFAILYTLKFWIDDFEQHLNIESDVLKRVWYHFKREGIQIPFPIRNVYLHPTDGAVDALAENVQMLKDVEFLQVLTDEQLRELAQRLTTQIYGRGETICRQGESGETFYIVKRGRVEVSTYNGQGQAVLRKQVMPGEFFGEFSLMTGEPRSATVTALEDTEVLVLGKEEMRRALAANAQLAEHISRLLALRRRQLEEQRALSAQRSPQEATAPARGVESLRRELLERILRFFSY
ncbi:MAG: mechanosensitive ion channel family protein [Abditibacteriales bacterium]|nr:mechanosensitive ion channel family protein [Abditibacteriales bacterium]MDW8364635.1 mechanosensitive ion channel family protein [Abditibacteriales bacterium]